MNWVCEDAWKAPLSQSMFFTGAIIGCIFFGWTSDTFGRYPTLMATNIILGIGGICLPLCKDFYCFATIRFVMGMTFNTFFIVAQILGELLASSFPVISFWWHSRLCFSYRIHSNRETLSDSCCKGHWHGCCWIFAAMGAQVPRRLEVVSSYYFYFTILCAVVPSVSLYNCLIVQLC